ncbi:ATP-dependent DNA helicase RecG [Nannocystis bainbridge]|uniref:ATP-dependent DNA helicase RecG n=1 Tax=Nannocystis bainbridge TaxID=2995303 RepID=A0ABT5E410_9BACT|nr:ATP-dependent DNA helicase RecG [Nannocystis bainbridge]MDC0720069.1 ATP-dependent DNA helicase RecG [Nannocystis bainbridge]
MPPRDSEAGELGDLPGVGPKTAAKLAAHGLVTLADLARVIPTGYRDRRHRAPLAEAADGAEAAVVATIRKFSQRFFRGRFFAGLDCVVEEGGREIGLQCQWFHRVGGLAERAQAGKRVLLVGRVSRKKGKLALIHPEIRDPEAPGPTITVRYPEVEGVGEATLAKLCRAALERLGPSLIDPLPPALRERLGLMALAPALTLLHVPDEALSVEAIAALQAGRSPAHRRLLFDELLVAQLALLRRRAVAQALPVTVTLLPGEGTRRELLRACVPFEPTQAQWTAIEEIEADLSRPRPMLRLLQGDVGSGKTLVAFAASAGIVAAGGQAAWMAPTEILAQQHAATLRPWCLAAGIRLALLTGSMSRSERAAVVEAAASGAAELVVGTHALLTEDVQFRRLGLVVVDEQHRFGVRQRALLRDKGRAPHLLVLTATPIPRTLALSLVGELDVSTLREAPPGRRPPDTTLMAGPIGRARFRLAEHVRRDMLQGFVVCPQIEAGAREASDVDEAATELRGLLPDKRIEVVHGRIDPARRAAAMAKFRAGAIDVLVATTVIEVGVDVPEARFMLIEHAEHFGLSQLHQLRGRIGRGTASSWCLLHTGAEAGSAAARRLQVLADTHDGFTVAERDLAERGPGELFGLRQAGRVAWAGLAGEGVALLEAARAAASEILASDPGLQGHAELRARVESHARPEAGDAG